MTSAAASSLQSRPVPPARWTLRADTPDADAAVEALYGRAFGPGRFAKAAHRVREDATLAREVSTLATSADGGLAGACRLWLTTRCTDGPAFLLGPIAVDKAFRGSGLGRALAGACVAAVDKRPGASTLVLVGDPAFFAPFGFEVAPTGAVRLPWPADPARTLWRTRA
jgi:predicted N-acetyltransferase YhbS